MSDSASGRVFGTMKKGAAWAAIAFALFALANFPIPGNAEWFLMPFEDKLPVVGNIDEVLAGVGLAWGLSVLRLNPIAALKRAREKKKAAAAKPSE